MEVTGCRLAMTGHGTLVIISVYLPFTKKLLRRDLRALLALGDAVILCGNFNCKSPRWSCPTTNYNGDKLNQLEDKLNLEITAPYYPDIATNRPSTLDTALTKEVVLNLNCIDTLHDLFSEHRPVVLKMGLPDGGSPNPTLKITDWKRVSTALEKIDTPSLISIPNGISTTDEMDSAIGANHVTYQPRQDSGREKRVRGSGALGSQEAPGRRSRIDMSKKRYSAPREHIPHC
ncbi:RNA-directed DNA polymerase from mobile element jockey [Eumeta japonica]|uniref:RNA-directed DNA polymerase from mobile element jockey n=1 Tax=Eumeta variegata TaxID=151549 RepID=A0A4C1TJE6_EUMVA|nr:RNA-directed DNA polymerase from mobile element jockey [Eumeta japonica]